ncbi:MAG: inosose dehydratase [Candidatus Nephthysia bennettiae]|uniref:TIM barrel protein n=2 Tax=Candidatus Nephthysia bennettiae TaxID=3127016 RepID=A0A934KEA5_9BACT|nr:TIM barrel protein [Candidatus Dormibacteraeota bacterium]MBJ7613305.1 TIM barrel protein [Candidatus Dormibacteraeota bacterium]PZR96328.1 MAG: inosose dehydratase [Candidatus Dormibacteraeota bacterium]
MPAERVLDEMRALGLEATELGPPGFLPAGGDALRARLEASGLRLVAGFLALDPRRPSGRALPGVLERTVLSLAAAGAEVLVLAAAGGGEGYDRRQRLEPPDWPGLSRWLKAARELAEAHGLGLAVHPHIGTLVEDGDDVGRLLELTDVDLCLDTGHLAVAGVEPLEVAHAAAGRIRHVHLKDVDGELAQEVRSGRISYAAAVARGLYRPLGQGSVDVAELVRHLEAGAFQGWYVLEQDVMLSAEPGPGEGPVRAARDSLRWLQRLLDRPPAAP